MPIFLLESRLRPLALRKIMSSLAIISDLHITHASDDGAKALKKFFSHPLVQQKETQTIIFLGDIFDFMCGFKVEYLEQYRFFFDLIEESIKLGKKIYYLEGNHDFHLQDLFSFFYQENFTQINSQKVPLIIRSDYFIYTLKKGRRIYFSHGDELPTKDYLYKLTRIFFRSTFAQFLIKVLDHKTLDRIGWTLSRKSRNSHGPRDKEKIEKIKTDFRKNAMEKGRLHQCDFVVAGHVHIEDSYSSEVPVDVQSFRGALRKCLYLNNGLPSESDQFIYIGEKDDGEVDARLVSLTP